MAMHATRSVPGAMIGHPDPLIPALRHMRAQVHAMMGAEQTEYRRGYLAAMRELAKALMEGKMVIEAIVDERDSRPRMRGPLIDVEARTIDDWVARLVEDEYGVKDVTEAYSGIVQLPHDLTTDRGVKYFAVTFYPGESPTVYAVWQQA